MSKVKITRENFSQALHQAVKQRGEEFVYPEDWKWTDANDYAICQYYLTGVGPACLIGVALDKLGVDVSELELKDETHVSGMDADQVLKRLGVKDQGLIDAASIAQRRQDTHVSWGESAREFDRVLGEN
jgi:hypothetical protein